MEGLGGQEKASLPSAHVKGVLPRVRACRQVEAWKGLLPSERLGSQVKVFVQRGRAWYPGEANRLGGLEKA